MRSWSIAVALRVLLLVMVPQGVLAGDADAALDDIRETYGIVPGFFRLFPEDEIAGIWYLLRTLQLNPYIAMDAKSRELISLGVATQGPCRPCVYFHAAAAFANGASREEIREAVGIAAVTHSLDAALVEQGKDVERFKRETDLLLWGDPKTVAEQGPGEGFCDFIIEWAADYAGCD